MRFGGSTIVKILLSDEKWLVKYVGLMSDRLFRSSLVSLY
jgi:hypothetical protein